ncbi:protein archease isoform X6 [Vulpes vulpes]|uniref:Protein archease n=1 Tax=Vulpes vulpes TaxID=9627 RepID=A0ABM4ZVA1_VULVU
MKGGSRVSSAAIMAQEEEDIRDYNLTEEQKAIKAKYPPAIRKYEYLDHTADVQLHAWGDTLEEAFEQCAMAMFGYMTDTGTVEPLQTVEVETQGDDLQSLLFHFLDEWLYKFSADEFFIPREVKVLQIDQRNFKLRSIGPSQEEGQGKIFLPYNWNAPGLRAGTSSLLTPFPRSYGLGDTELTHPSKGQPVI